MTLKEGREMSQIAKRVSSQVEIVGSFHGVHITDDFSWNKNITSLVKKAQKCLHFLRRLKKAGMSNIIMINFCGEHPEQ